MTMTAEQLRRSDPPATATSDTGTANTDTARVVADWVRLWNGDLDVAPAVLADDLTVHAARVDDANQAAAGPQALLSWITGLRTVIPDARFDIDLGPLVDDQMVVVRWIATGHYAAGFPGATRPTGTPVCFSGTDILRLADGRIAEYWVNADMHVLLGQLGILPT